MIKDMILKNKKTGEHENRIVIDTNLQADPATAWPVPKGFELVEIEAEIEVENFSKFLVKDEG